MSLFSPAWGGRGRLLVAVAISILMHGFALGYRWGDVWQQAASKSVVAVVRGGDLTVILDSRQVPEVSFLKSREVLVSTILDQQEATRTKSFREPRDDERRAVPASGEYLTKEHLSVSAQALSDIHIPWPPGLPVVGVKSAVFTIFIDEVGVVRDVVPDGHTLSPVMEEVARDAFLAATFRPALLNGRAVKSIKRIEVEFEFLPIKQPQDAPEVVGKKELL
ncbi:MAG: hypothetical protein KJ716_08835 [Gammaproteobacteria bacterium]|nr:hypothetical protein [Gammaproteobacteria bacterium]